MRTAFILGAALSIWAGPGFAQGAPPAPIPLAPKPPVAAPAKPPVAAAKPAPAAAAAARSTPASRTAEQLAASPDPTFDEGTYGRIKEALLSYSALQVRGGWPTIPADAKFAPGATGPTVALLRHRLAITEDLAPEKETGDAYDAVLVEAVKRFQLRHGLPATGAIGPQTLAALNVPIAKRLKQLQASLERLVGMDFTFGERYVVVNIPGAYTEAIENDKVARRYRVIVGKTDKPSPTLTAYITDVDLNPTWTVPLSITKTEITAHMRKDPSYLSRMHMRLLDGHDNEIAPTSVDWSSDRSPNFVVRQDSGTFNALGAVKINMPNPYSVYMHDTNTRNLFADDYRFDSHGCTRVDNVRDLAAWVLKDLPKWTPAAIDDGIAAGQKQEIRLPRKIPVAWIYLTGWMTRGGVVQFRDDVYAHDDQLVAASTDPAFAAMVESARAGGFVAARPIGSPAPAAAAPRAPIKQVSNLDSR
jgi:murein L,D-transpeptidase YcbB/YkuD